MPSLGAILKNLVHRWKGAEIRTPLGRAPNASSIRRLNLVDPRNERFLHKDRGKFPVLFHNWTEVPYAEKCDLTRRWLSEGLIASGNAGEETTAAPHRQAWHKRSSIGSGSLSATREEHLFTSVNIVFGDSSGWILGRIADELAMQFRALGLRAEVSPKPLRGFDIVYYVPFHSAAPGHARFVDSMMVTHLDTRGKTGLAVAAIRKGVAAIALSHQTASELASKLRFGRGFVDYCLLPGMLSGQRRIHLGLFFRLYSDGRKKENIILELLDKVDPSRLHFHIMGAGWSDLSVRLSRSGALVDYNSDFDPETYEKALRSCDFTVLTGRDEGAVAFLDSLSVGTRVIAPPIGYHLDYANPRVKYADGADEIAAVILEELRLLDLRHQVLGESNWARYAKEHIAIWQAVFEGNQKVRLHGAR